LFDRASTASEKEVTKEFMQRPAEAFCLDTHNFTMVVAGGNHTRRVCTIVSLFEGKGENSDKFHTLKMAMAVMDCSGFVYIDGSVYNDYSRN
jgi:hypothetical protein